MKIFILEDDNAKCERVKEIILNQTWLEVPEVRSSSTLSEAQRILEREVFDFLILDLMVPLRPDTPPTDVTPEIIAIRLDPDCKNRATPAVALTQFEERAIERFKELNECNVTVITYDETSTKWRHALGRTIEDNRPPTHFDFVIVCALRKERDAYVECGYTVGEEVILEDLSCVKISLGNHNGVMIVPTRMGLVGSAIACTKAIERFKPKLIAMSGICAGFDSSSEIYDVVIPQTCYQHDYGKWTNEGFIVEPYQIQLENSIRLKIDQTISRKGFSDQILEGLRYITTEVPEGRQSITSNVKLSVSSSGSAVVASDAQSTAMKSYHRKGVAFEMEAYALYDAAVSSHIRPAYFSAKCVVDNGTSGKSDHYQRIACLLSAKVTAKLALALLDK